MNNHINMLSKQAKFDLKSSKVRWQMGLRPRPRWESLQHAIRKNLPHHEFLATSLIIKHIVHHLSC